MENKKIGIVTVTYNSAAVIDDFIQSLLGQTFSNFILYLVDNASSDDTLHKVAKYSDPRIIIISNLDNKGVAAGNNQGIKEALDVGCEQILLINNDTVFEDQLIQKLSVGLIKNQCDMIVPKIMYYDKPNTIWCAGGFFNSLRAFGGYHYGLDEVDKGQWDTPSLIEYSPTCCMLINRQVFETIGYMDEKYFVYYDDTDFCFRAMKAAVRMFYLPTAKLQHKVSSLTGGESPFSLRYMARNRAYFIRKNLTLKQQILALGYYQGWCFFRLLLGQDNLQIFWLRQVYLREGCSLV